MIIRFGFVAMSVTLENASPSKTVTWKTYQELAKHSPEAALDKLRKTARENIATALRLLQYCRANFVYVYRFSSKMIPLATHPELQGWDYIGELTPDLQQLGDFIRAHKMRVTFHPDHFTLLNSPREEVFTAAIADLAHHCRLFNAMGLDDTAKLIIHIGGAYHDKEESLERFIENWGRVPNGIARRMTIENDDKSYTAQATLAVCEKLQLPMVLDLHHHYCNQEEHSSLAEIIPRFVATWDHTGLPPKIHLSSPRSLAAIRSHHDFVDAASIYPQLLQFRKFKTDLDAMVEAKQKDQALMRLVQELQGMPGIERINAGAIEL